MTQTQNNKEGKMRNNVIIATERSGNKKTGIVSVTYAPMTTCPSACPFLNAGCYAQSGPTMLHLSRINKASDGMTRIDIAKAEADAILLLTGKRPLRLHVVGDCATDETAKIVSAACMEYASRHAQAVWIYTHAWRNVSVDSWNEVSVLASCETASDIVDAYNRGYAPAITGTPVEVEEFRSIICLAQTKGISCARCRLCWDVERLRKNRSVVTFLPHGARKKAANAAVEVLRKGE